MEIKATRFGTLQIKESDVLEIVNGVLGFPDYRKYVIFEHDAKEESPFKWLQCIDNPDLAFVVIDPRLFKPDYQIEIDQESAQLLFTDKPGDYIPMVIVKIPRDDPAKMTANLRGPIVVNAETRRGCQIVLSNEKYSFDHLIFPTVATSQSKA